MRPASYLFLCSTLLGGGSYALAAPSPPTATPPTPHATAPAPQAFVQGKVDFFAKLLAAQKPGLRDTLQTETRKLFDFDTFVARSLGKRWQELKPEEREHFRQALVGRMESAYLNDPKSIFDRNKVTITGSSVHGDTSEVTATIDRGADPSVEVTLQLKQQGDGWVVYNAVIDEMSLLENYQDQFRTMLKTKTIDDLIARLNRDTKR